MVLRGNRLTRRQPADDVAGGRIVEVAIVARIDVTRRGSSGGGMGGGGSLQVSSGE